MGKVYCQCSLSDVLMKCGLYWVGIFKGNDVINRRSNGQDFNSTSFVVQKLADILQKIYSFFVGLQFLYWRESRPLSWIWAWNIVCLPILWTKALYWQATKSYWFSEDIWTSLFSVDRMDLQVGIVYCESWYINELQS